MAAKRRKRASPVFEVIRKPTAPPSRQFGEKKPEEKAHPAGRSAKHKHGRSDKTDADL